MPTRSLHFPRPVLSGERVTAAGVFVRPPGPLAACRVTTEVFVNRAARPPVAAALFGWVPRVAPHDLPTAPGARRRPSPGSRPSNLCAAHA
jgi:hypothetical protein